MNSILIAVEKGYYFDKDDNVIGMRGKIMRYRLSPKGYPRFNIRTKGKNISVMLHRLKAYFLFGDKIFENGIEVRHLNGIKTDWSDKNIAIGSSSDNTYDIPKDIRVKKAIMATSCITKVTEMQREEIRLLKKSGVTLMEIAKKYGLKSKRTVSMIINRKKCYKQKAHI